MADKPALGKQGKRYSAEEKAEIVEFIAAFDSEHKRGGMTAASEKFGVSVVTLSNWKNKGKGPQKAKRKAKAKKVVAKKTVKTAPSVAKVVTDAPEAILSRLQAILTEIQALEKEYNALKKNL